MSTNLKYLKGVRTRFCNILYSEIKVASSLIENAQDENNEGELKNLISDISICQEKIKTYIAKLELQSEKVCETIVDDDELISTILEEDSKLCSSANDACDRLKRTEYSLREEIKHLSSPPQTKTTEMEKLLEIQKELQKELVTVKTEKSKPVPVSVKLPRLDIITFNGNRLQWMDFWQSFENSVHNNSSLSNIDKFNYLRSKLVGEARGVITGLSLCHENYDVAIGMLSDRYGNIQETIDLRYNKLINLKPANESIESLRILTDSFNKHLRSLEALKQNINQDIFVSVFKTKLPSSVIRHLEIQKGSTKRWTVPKLIDLLGEYVSACEKSEKVNKTKTGSHEKGYGSGSKGAAEALPVNTKDINTPRNQCRYCSGKHWSDECPEYTSIFDRKRCLKGSCFKCLKAGHMASECKSQKTCVYCKEVNVHHRSLCPKKFKTNVIRESVQIADEQDNSATETPDKENTLLSSNEIVLMQTARVQIKNPKGYRTEEVRVLLDSGSQRTYITERLATSLNLERTKDKDIQLVTFGSEKTKVIKTSISKVNLMLKCGKEMAISANVVPSITGTIHRKKICVKDRQNLERLVENLNLADTIPSKTETSTIDILIGNDYYLDIVMGHKLEVQKGLYLLSSRLGWILTGRTDEIEDVEEMSMLILTYGNNISKTEVFSVIADSIPVKPNLEDFWNLEAIGILDKKEDKHDEIASEHFKDNLVFKDDRYHVTWPWKETVDQLPENRMLAMGRLRSLISRLKSRPELMKRYNDIIQEQLEKDIIEKVARNRQDGIKHYIPHHAVVKPDKSTTKLRIVYDASAKAKHEDKSFNECLYRGPVLLCDLCGILVRFRMHRIGIVADIEKAFLQVGLQPNQRDVTRFLWLKNPDNCTVDTENIQEYRFRRVPFGIISSPFLLGATVNYHLEKDGSELAQQIKRDIYMDNVVSEADSIQEASSVYADSKKVFSEAGMNLREWASNSEELEECIPEHDKVCDEVINVLGLEWNKTKDTISLKEVRSFDSDNITKRTVLKKVASVFDPLGLFSPVVLKGKTLIQMLWTKHLDWDEELNNEDRNMWLSIKDDLKRIPDISFPRCVKMKEVDRETNSLVCFCDASGKACAAIVYFVQHSNCKHQSDVIFAKTRLAPTKTMTIPRLELMAVLIGVRSINFIKSQVAKPVSDIKIFTDSQCVLGWLKSKKQLPVFVRNRIQEIKKENEISFHFVKSEDNPADIASRGCSSGELKENRLWWNGPVWLQNPSQDPMYEKDETKRILEKTIRLKRTQTKVKNVFCLRKI